MTGGAAGAAAGLGFTSFAFPANDTTAPMIAPKITNMHVNKIAYLFVHPVPFLCTWSTTIVSSGVSFLTFFSISVVFFAGLRFAPYSLLDDKIGSLVLLMCYRSLGAPIENSSFLSSSGTVYKLLLELYGSGFWSIIWISSLNSSFSSSGGTYDGVSAFMSVFR